MTPPRYASDSPWSEAEYLPFDHAEYSSDHETDWEREQQQQAAFEAWRRRDQRYAHIGGSLILLMFFVGLPLAAAGVHVLIHL